MRKIIVLSMLTLDGVVQAPGGPSEDTSGNFELGGWVAPYFDEAYGNVMAKQMKPSDLLLGRKTFEIFASYWPVHENIWPGINNVTKYVMSSTVKSSEWQNCVFIQTLQDIRDLKSSPAGSNAASTPDLQVHGSGRLVQLLLASDLVDELWLKIHPVILGRGKRIFGQESVPASFTLTETTVTPSGVIIANYIKAGPVKTGTVGE